MKYQIQKTNDGDCLVVAANEATGENLTVLFHGRDAKRHAEEYAEWKNRQQEVTGEQLLKR